MHQARALSAILFLGFALSRCSCSETPGANGTGGDGAPSGDGQAPSDAAGADVTTDSDAADPAGDGGMISDPDGSTMGCIDGLEAIVLSPASLDVTLNGGAAQPITFSAEGRLRGGATQAIDPARLTWTATRSDDTPPGTIDRGVLAPYPGAGGEVIVGAGDGCVRGSAVVRFFLDVVVSTSSAPPSADWNAAPTSNGPVPLIVYPSDQTRFPRNIYRTLFQWRSGPAREFRLRFEGPRSVVTIYTSGDHALCSRANPVAGCWEADELAWSYIAGSNAGEVVRWTVDGLDRTVNPPAVRRGASIEIGFSRRDVRGAIFYWSTTSAGIRRANIRAAEPEDYITGQPRTTYPNDEVRCVACHVVSRDGRFMAAPVSADSGASLWIMEVTNTAPPSPLVKSVADTRGHGFATISPDNRDVVAAWRGRLWMVDRATGAPGADLPLGALSGTHPDWSPDDSQLVFATGDGDAPGGASIALIPWNRAQRSWGTPSILVEAGGQTNLFPMFSPGGDWIAYSRGRGGHGDDRAQLYVVSPRIGQPIELIRANRVVSNTMTDGQHQNSLPTWAPPGDLAWVAFNSKREYGVVRGGGVQQIWVAAVDLARAGSGPDPSYPAFRLQFQGLEENNHRAFWALDVREEPPVDAGVAPDAAADAGVPPDSGATPDAGPPDSGAPPPDAGVSCVATGSSCTQGVDRCCDPLDTCTSFDNGATFACYPSI